MCWCWAGMTALALRLALPLPAAAGQSPRALFEFQLFHSNFFYHRHCPTFTNLSTHIGILLLHAGVLTNIHQSQHGSLQVQE